MAKIEVPVLIVGGGAAGLTASMLLSKLGVESLLVSALPTTSILPKAHVLNQRCMEIFTDLGVAEEIYERGTPAENMRYSAYYAGLAGPDPVYGRQLGRLECWGAGGLDADWASASPCRQANLPQIRLEPILKARAEALAPGRVRFHNELIDLEQDAGGVTATVMDKAQGTEFSVRARYLLACDAGRTVGPRLGVKLEGPRDLMRIVSVYMTADLSRFARDEPLFAELDRRHAVVFVHPSELPGPRVPGVPPFAADFLLDTTRAAYRLVQSGALRRHPNLKIILAHAGGFLPYASHRLMAALLAEGGRPPADLLEDLRSFYFETALSGSPAALPSLLAFAKPGHVLFGSDWPYAPAMAVAYFTGQLDAYEPLDAIGHAALDRGNAESLFPAF